MSAPPKYPRIPHVSPSPAASPDDLVLSRDARAALLRAEVVVEEKLDGMNVMVWIDDGTPRVGTRGGADTADRSGERGRLRAWASAHADALRAGLGDDHVLYGEWLRRRHAVPYDRLPALLVGFDVLDRRSERFVRVAERDALLARAGIVAAPVRFHGVLGSVDRLEQLLGASALGDARAEGLVIRTTDGVEPRAAKRIDPAWAGIGSASWAGENRLAAPAAAAH